MFGFQKKDPIDTFDAAFMLKDLEILSALDGHILHMPAHLIKRFSPDTLSIMEFRTQKDIDVVTTIYSWPLLGEDLDSIWAPKFKREFNMTDNRSLFNENQIGWPLYEGKMIHQYTQHFSEERYWLEPNKARDELARLEIQRAEEMLDILTSSYTTHRASTRQSRIKTLLAQQMREQLTTEDVRIDTDRPRLAFRKIARNTDERTMIAAILQPKVFASDSLYCLVPWRFDASRALTQLHDLKSCYTPSIPDRIMVYLCGVFNSFALDYVLRFKINTNVNIFHVYQLPVPRLTENDAHCRAIARRVAQLVCVGPEFDELRCELLGDVNARVLPFEEKEARQQVQNEIDALIAHLYELGRKDLEHILYAPYTFPLVKREIKDGVMREFARVEQLLQGEG